MTSQGCSGPPAQVEILTGQCAVRLSPLQSVGTFTCNNTGIFIFYGIISDFLFTLLTQCFLFFADQTSSFTRYGRFENSEFTYTDCALYDEMDLISDDNPVESFSQPFECTRVVGERKNGEDASQLWSDPYVLYQTITCVPQ